MKLQINTRGAWKDVVEFDAARYFEVVDAVRMLKLALGAGPAFSIVDDGGSRDWLFGSGEIETLEPSS